MNIFLIAAALATAPNVAPATGSDRACKGADAMIEQRPDAQTVVRNSGNAGDPATVVRRGAQGEIVVEQSGPCNAAAVAQTGRDNRATVRQRGSGNRVVVSQGPAPERKP